MKAGHQLRQRSEGVTSEDRSSHADKSNLGHFLHRTCCNAAVSHLPQYSGLTPPGGSGGRGRGVQMLDPTGAQQMAEAAQTPPLGHMWKRHGIRQEVDEDEDCGGESVNSATWDLNRQTLKLQKNIWKKNKQIPDKSFFLLHFSEFCFGKKRTKIFAKFINIFFPLKQTIK